MYLNKNSGREEVINYINKYPTSFLFKYSHEPWSQSYLDKAAKEATSRGSYFFLHYFSHKPWAQPYIDEAAKNAVRDSPFGFLSNLSDKPWAQPYIDDAVKEAVKKNPEFFLEKWADKYPQGINCAIFSLGGENGSK